MKQPLGITFTVPPGQEATGVYESEDGIEVFETDDPYLLSDGQSLTPPLPVKIVDGPTFLDSMGRLQSAIPVSGIGPTPPPDYGTDFVFVMRTTGPGETVTIPCQNNGTFNAVVDWGDGSTSNVTAWNDANLTHEYVTPGVYEIMVSGSFPNVYFNNGVDSGKVLRVLQLGDVGWSSLRGAFSGCNNLYYFKASPCVTSGVTDFSFMLFNCSGFIDPPDLSGLDTSSATLAIAMFEGLESMTSPPDLSDFDGSMMVDQSGMFRRWSSITAWPDVSSLASPAVTNLFRFVSNGSSTPIGIDSNLHLLDISSVTNLNDFAAGSTLTTEAYDALLISWAAQDPNSNLNAHFGNSIFTPSSEAQAARDYLVTEKNWTITDGGPATYGDDFVFDVRTTTSNETFTIPCQDFSTFNATIDWGDGTTSTITAWNDPGLAHEYVAAGTYRVRVSGLFTNIRFNNGGDKNKLRKVVQLGDVGWRRLDTAFWGCFADGPYDDDYFTAGPCNTSNVVTMASAFRGWSAVTTPPDFTGLDTSASNSFSEAMDGWSNMTSPPDLSGFDTSNATSVVAMMRGWTSMLTPPDLSGFDTSNASSFTALFENWNSMLTPPDLSGFDTSNIGSMQRTIQGWSAMTPGLELGIQNWDISGLTNPTGFALGTTLSVELYDAVLIAWSAYGKTGLNFHFGNSKYSPAAAAARASIISDGNTITDGGPA